MEGYDRILRTEALILAEIQQLPRGYISTKKISGREYHYLQFREEGKVKSRYIKSSELDAIRTGIDTRKRDERALADLEKSKQIVVRALGKELIHEYTTDGISEIH